MNSKKIVISLLLLFSIVSIAQAKVIEKVVAVVNGEIITLYELDKAMAPYIGKIKKSAYYESEYKELKKKTIDQLIDNLLLKQEIEASDFEVTDQEVNQAINNILTNNNISIDQLKDELNKNGVSFKEYRKNIELELKKNRFISTNVGSKITFTDDELKNYYMRNLNKFAGKQQIHLAQILLPYTKSGTQAETEELRNKMEQIRKETTTQKEFFNAARKYSQGPFADKGGDLGKIDPANLIPEIANAASALSEGQISQPIFSNIGVHLIYLIERPKAKAEDFEKAKDLVSRVMYEERMEQEINNYLLQLRQKAYIDIKE